LPDKKIVGKFLALEQLVKNIAKPFLVCSVVGFEGGNLVWK
jgi:hypothetical protein